jgi:hypothetical protein
MDAPVIVSSVRELVAVQVDPSSPVHDLEAYELALGEQLLVQMLENVSVPCPKLNPVPKKTKSPSKINFV